MSAGDWVRLCLFAPVASMTHRSVVPVGPATQATLPLAPGNALAEACATGAVSVEAATAATASSATRVVRRCMGSPSFSGGEGGSGRARGRGAADEAIERDAPPSRIPLAPLVPDAPRIV